MKTFSKQLIIVFILITACSDDDDKKMKLSPHELLLKYDWIVFSVVRNPGPIPEPDLFYVVWSFSETGYSGSDFTGTFYNLGDWSIEDEMLTLDGESVPILELTGEKFVYEAADGEIITRLDFAYSIQTDFSVLPITSETDEIIYRSIKRTNDKLNCEQHGLAGRVGELLSGS